MGLITCAFCTEKKKPMRKLHALELPRNARCTDLELNFKIWGHLDLNSISSPLKSCKLLSSLSFVCFSDYNNLCLSEISPVQGKLSILFFRVQALIYFLYP